MAPHAHTAGMAGGAAGTAALQLPATSCHVLQLHCRTRPGSEAGSGAGVPVPVSMETRVTMVRRLEAGPGQGEEQSGVQLSTWPLPVCRVSSGHDTVSRGATAEIRNGATHSLGRRQPATAVMPSCHSFFGCSKSRFVTNKVSRKMFNSLSLKVYYL